ncbi:MAG: hypothetical protein AABY22_20080 [Nanoarchaeota archaeon]
MCGIIGYSGLSLFNIDKIKILFLYNETRGEDSTGLYTPENGIVKSIDSVSDFIYNKKIKISNMLIGHCRKCSMGTIRESNAHPFEIDNIIGVHNGHIKNTHDLCTWDEKRYFDLDIDSQMIMYLLSKYKDPRFLYKINGSAALLFTDKRTNIVYAFRNDQKPLFYGKIKKDMYISSIEDSLKAIGCKNIESFKENYLYQIESGKITKKLFICNKEKILKINKKNFVDGRYILNSDLVERGSSKEGDEKLFIAKKDEIIEVKFKDNKATFISSVNGTPYEINCNYLNEINEDHTNINENIENDDSKDIKVDASKDIAEIGKDDNKVMEIKSNNELEEELLFGNENISVEVNDVFNLIYIKINEIINSQIVFIEEYLKEYGETDEIDIITVINDTRDQINNEVTSIYEQMSLEVGETYSLNK